jgi:hypothetical protein
MKSISSEKNYTLLFIGFICFIQVNNTLENNLINYQKVSDIINLIK